MARTAKQRAAQLKAAKASALARKKKALRGSSAYADSQSPRGTSRTYTRADYSSGPPIGTRSGKASAMRIDKPKAYVSKTGNAHTTTSNPRRTAIRKIEATGNRARNITIHNIQHQIGMRKPSKKK